MNLKKEFVIVIWLILILFLMGFLNSTKELITGEAGRIALLKQPLEVNEYLLYVNQAQSIEGKRVELLGVTESGDAIVSVSGSKRSISDKIIVNNGLQIKKSIAVKETLPKRSFAVLEIIKVEQDIEMCEETDNGYNINLKGICYDDHYEMGVEDFCDNEYLKEYSCEYDEYVDKIHCMKETVKCEKGCSDGRCVSDIRAY